jgi:hypothetical protein
MSLPAWALSSPNTPLLDGRHTASHLTSFYRLIPSDTVHLTKNCTKIRFESSIGSFIRSSSWLAWSSKEVSWSQSPVHSPGLSQMSFVPTSPGIDPTSLVRPLSPLSFALGVTAFGDRSLEPIDKEKGERSAAAAGTELSCLYNREQSTQLLIRTSSSSPKET